MALTPSAAFAAKNELDYKTPMYVVDFQVDPDLDTHVKYCTYLPNNPIAPTALPYVSNISGGGYNITPDEGSTSSAQLTIELIDRNREVTTMIYEAVGNLQKKQCNVKAGYLGMDEADMLDIFSGQVTAYDYKTNGIWKISVSDAIRDLNRYVFRSAGEGVGEETVIAGNPITLLLALLISDQGDGTNGIYDFLPPGTGIGMDPSRIDIAKFESIRETYFPSTTSNMKFTITGREQTNDFLKNEFYTPLNMYPIVKGNGQYSATIYSPPLPPYAPQTILEGDTIGIPKYDGNLAALINEVEFSYNVQPDGTFEDITVFQDGTSISERGAGDRTLEIKSRGLDSNETNTEEFITRSTNRIFSRYANPPIKLDCKVVFNKLLVEGGDVLLVSNKFLPNLSTGNFDYEMIPMEVLKRTVDWKNGNVSLTLLQTGFRNLKYAAISPTYTVATGISTTQFTVEDNKDWKVGFKGRMYQWDISTRKFRQLSADDITVTDINTTTKTITTTTMANVPQANWRFVFSDKANETAEQLNWSIIDGTYHIIP